MKIALVLHRRMLYLLGYPDVGPDFQMTAHVLDDSSEEGRVELIKRLNLQREPLPQGLVEELEVHKVLDMPTIPRMTQEVTRILAGPCSVYRRTYEGWLTEIVSSAFAKGEGVVTDRFSHILVLALRE